MYVYITVINMLKVGNKKKYCGGRRCAMSINVQNDYIRK